MKHFPTLLEATVPAGFPSPAQDYLETRIDLNEKLIKHPSATFLIQVMGDSMVGDGILPGSTLVIDRALEAGHGRVVLAVLNGEFTVKRLLKKKPEIWLMPSNPKFSPIIITKEMDFQVWGVVTWVLHELKEK
jgi:DNA polymerase V